MALEEGRDSQFSGHTYQGECNRTCVMSPVRNFGTFELSVAINWNYYSNFSTQC